MSTVLARDVRIPYTNISFSKNTLYKTAQVGACFFYIAGGEVAVVVMVANLAFSKIIKPAEQNDWFNKEHLTKDITSSYNCSFYVVKIVLFVGANFFKSSYELPAQAILKSFLFSFVGGSYLTCANIIFQACILVPVIEEIIFRGFIQEKIRDLQGYISIGSASSEQKKTRRVVLQAILFGLVHYNPKNQLNSAIILGRGFSGYAYGRAKENSKHLWSSVALHSFDNVISYANVIFSYERYKQECCALIKKYYPSGLF